MCPIPRNGSCSKFFRAAIGEDGRGIKKRRCLTAPSDRWTPVFYRFASSCGGAWSVAWAGAVFCVLCLSARLVGAFLFGWFFFVLRGSGLLLRGPGWFLSLGKHLKHV